jgi:hypothetical protein
LRRALAPAAQTQVVAAAALILMRKPAAVSSGKILGSLAHGHPHCRGTTRSPLVVRGYHPLLATVREPGQAGEVLHTRLRRGNAASGQGGGHFLTEALGRVRAAGASGPLLVRADAGFYARSVVRACRRTGARFSITVRTNPAITAAIAASRTPPGRRFRTGTRRELGGDREEPTSVVVYTVAGHDRLVSSPRYRDSTTGQVLNEAVPAQQEHLEILAGPPNKLLTFPSRRL